MNGLEFVMAVRKQKHLRQMTLMMVTAEAIIDKLTYLGLVPLAGAGTAVSA
jgi:hypothetical protein